jgi:transposase-like protein
VAQRFLLSAAARTLSLRSIYAEGEQAAYRRSCALRWPETGGKPVCPACGCLDVYDLTTRRRCKCAACHRQFSVTSGTIFASRKLACVDLLAAICLVVNAAKGLSAVQLSRDLDVQHKTAVVLMHKPREAMAAETRDARLTGAVELDGAAFGGHARPARQCARGSGRSPPARAPQRQAPRGRRPAAAGRANADPDLPARGRGRRLRTGKGGTRFGHLGRRGRARGPASVELRPAADQSLRPLQPRRRPYQSRRELLLAAPAHDRRPASRGRRAERLGAYAGHAAWLEDHRRQSNGALADRLIAGALAAPVSRAWKGYWQRAA